MLMPVGPDVAASLGVRRVYACREEIANDHDVIQVDAGRSGGSGMVVDRDPRETIVHDHVANHFVAEEYDFPVRERKSDTRARSDESVARSIISSDRVIEHSVGQLGRRLRRRWV